MYFLEDNVPEGETRAVEIESVQSHFNYGIFFQTEGEESETAVFKTS